MVTDNNNKNKKNNNKYSNIMIIICVIILAALGYTFSTRNIKDNKPTVAPVKETVSVAEIPMARIDITTRPVEENPQFEVYLNEDTKPLNEAMSMPKSHNMQGVVIHRNNGVADITIKPLKDVKIIISLRGVGGKTQDGKAIENWVKYTSFTIDGEKIIPEDVSVWYGKPFVYDLEAKDGKTYKLHLEWQQD